VCGVKRTWGQNSAAATSRKSFSVYLPSGGAAMTANLQPLGGGLATPGFGGKYVIFTSDRLRRILKR
jgi:hypothetical protein